MADRKVKRRELGVSSFLRGEPPTRTVADQFKTALGWKPSMEPFHTTANRECGSCYEIKPGSEFDVPITPGCLWLNLCRGCLM
jgi:hypothetical protein